MYIPPFNNAVNFDLITFVPSAQNSVNFEFADTTRTFGQILISGSWINIKDILVYKDSAWKSVSDMYILNGVSWKITI